MLTLEQVAEKLNVKLNTLRKWRWRVGNGLPVDKKVGRLCRQMAKLGTAIRIPEEAVEEFLMSERRSKISETGIKEEMNQMASRLRSVGNKEAAMLLEVARKLL